MTMMVNSIWYAAGGAFLTVVVSAATAYAVAKYKFIGSRIIFWAALITLMVPVVNNLPSLLRFSNKIGIYNSPLILVTQLGGLGFNFIVLYSFFKHISREYMEAAFIDGAGHFHVFIKIMLPFAIAPMIALWLSAFNALWSDPMFPMLFLTSYPTLAYGLYIYQIDINRVPGGVPMLFAGLFISAVPVIALFAAFQKMFLDLQISGGIKG